MAILHIDLNSFFARAEQQANSQLRDKPIGVLGKGHKGARTCVVAASPEAKKWGVKSGMSVGETQKLCPPIILVPPNYPRYLDISRRFIAILDRFSPWVEIFSIDEAFVALSHDKFESRNPKSETNPKEIKSTSQRTPEFKNLDLENCLGFRASDFGFTDAATQEAITTAHQIKYALKHELGELITASVGIAWGKIFAKLAGELKKPDGLTVLSPDTWLETVGQLPIDELCGIGHRLTNALNILGIRTIQHLTHADAGTLTARFGPSAGMRLWEIGQGIDRTSVAPHTELAAAKSIGHQVTLDRPQPIGTLWPTIAKLTNKVARRLRHSRLHTESFNLHLSLQNGNGWGKSLTLQAAATDIRLQTAARKLYSEIPLAPHLQVFRVGVVASKLTAAATAQPLAIFPQEQRDEAITEALDHLRDTYGDDAISWGGAHAVDVGNLRDWRGPRAVLDQ